MSRTVTSEKELGQALKENENTIIVEGDLGKKVLKIKVTGKVAWAIAIGGIAVAIIAVLPTGGAGAPAAAMFSSPVLAILGWPTALSAALISISAGGVAALNKLRRYKIVENTEGRLVLKQ